MIWKCHLILTKMGIWLKILSLPSGNQRWQWDISHSGRCFFPVKPPFIKDFPHVFPMFSFCSHKKFHFSKISQLAMFDTGGYLLQDAPYRWCCEMKGKGGDCRLKPPYVRHLERTFWKSHQPKEYWQYWNV